VAEQQTTACLRLSTYSYSRHSTLLDGPFTSRNPLCDKILGSALISSVRLSSQEYSFKRLPSIYNLGANAVPRMQPEETQRAPYIIKVKIFLPFHYPYYYLFQALSNASLISPPTPQKINNSKLYKGHSIIGRRRILYNKYYF
jgi:hypothetical protein